MYKIDLAKESIANFDRIIIKKEKSQVYVYDNTNDRTDTIYSVKYDNKQLCIQTDEIECSIYQMYPNATSKNIKLNQTIKRINDIITVNFKHDYGICINKYEQPSSRIKLSRYIEFYDVNGILISPQKFYSRKSSRVYGKYSIIFDHIYVCNRDNCKAIDYCWKVTQIQKLPRPDQISDESDDTESLESDSE
jgi:hypothetical protein